MADNSNDPYAGAEISNSSADPYEGAAIAPKPNFNNILQQAALQSVRTVANPYQAMVPPQMVNAVATDPGVGGDVGAMAGYGVAHPILGGALGQAGADSAKQLEGYFGSGGEKDVNLPEIMGQGAVGAGKGVLTKLGVGAGINMIPGMKNFTVNKLVDAAQGNRADLSNDYGSALDAMESKYTNAGKYADIEGPISQAANPGTTGPTSSQQSVAQHIIDEAAKRGIDLSKLSPKDFKQVQDIFDEGSGIWEKNTSNVDRARSGIGKMDEWLTAQRNSNFPEFKGADDSFSEGVQPFNNLKVNSRTGPNEVARMMDRSTKGFSGAVRSANQPGVFGNFGSQVMNDAAGFQQSVRFIGNMLQRAAQMASGVGAGYGIGKGLGPPPAP